MSAKNIIWIILAALILLGMSVGYHVLSSGSKTPELMLSTVVRRELRAVVSTNGIIEPVGRAEIFAPFDAFVTNMPTHEGSEVVRGQLLMRLESQQLMTALAEARAALIQAKNEARMVAAGAPKEEVAAMRSSIVETTLQLRQQREDLMSEENLLKKGATTREAVENLQKQVELLQLRMEGLKQKEEGLLHRHTDDEKQLLQDRVSELIRQVELLEQQVQAGSILARQSGVIYSLAVNQGSYVSKGQLLAQLYQPGKVRLRAYIDEPDLGRVVKGQRTLIDWDGLPDKRWNGVVDRPAQQVVALGNRFVGYALCAFDGEPKELMPNINVKVQIVTAGKAGALVIPRTAVFNDNGKPAVMLSNGVHTVLRPVLPGLITPEEIEILEGVEEGNRVVTHPGDARKQ